MKVFKGKTEISTVGEFNQEFPTLSAKLNPVLSPLNPVAMIDIEHELEKRNKKFYKDYLGIHVIEYEIKRKPSFANGKSETAVLTCTELKLKFEVERFPEYEQNRVIVDKVLRSVLDEYYFTKPELTIDTEVEEDGRENK